MHITVAKTGFVLWNKEADSGKWWFENFRQQERGTHMSKQAGRCMKYIKNQRN